jgi:RNA polymerase sigma factor (TIGR02999 family)
MKMSASSPQEVMQLLVAWSNGDKAALDRLMPLVYGELHRLAHHYMTRERPGHSLQTTALVNEAYFRLVDQKQVHWKNRAHFFGIAAQLMRRILVDDARNRGRAKRGGNALKVSLDEGATLAQGPAAELIALDDALLEMAAIDPRRSQVVELRFFGGLSVAETAEVLGISPNTVVRDWNMAKAWLYREVSKK